jgi:hypothetical protein
MSLSASRLKPLRSMIVGAGVVLALAGCEGTIISNNYQDNAYGPGEWRGNDVPVLVRGTPYALPQAEIDQAVTDAMQGTTFGVPTRFISSPGGSSAAYRVVMMFGPPAGVDGYALCASRPEPPSGVFGTAPAGQVNVIAAFCRGDRAVTSAEGRIGTGAGPHSPEFQHGVSQFAVVLFPGHMNDHPGGDGSPKAHG